MIRNRYGSLIESKDHLTRFRARSDPSLPFMAIGTQEIGFSTSFRLYCKILNRQKSPPKNGTGEVCPFQQGCKATYIIEIQTINNILKL